MVPGVIWIYDFTHFSAAKRCAVAVMDVARVRAGRERGRGVRSVGAGPHHRADRKLDSLRVLGEAGVPAASYATVKRRLPGSRRNRGGSASPRRAPRTP
jgi:hypothetical protein